MTDQYILVEYWQDKGHYKRLDTLEHILAQGVRLEGAQVVRQGDSIYVPVAYVRYDKVRE